MEKINLETHFREELNRDTRSARELAKASGVAPSVVLRGRNGFGITLRNASAIAAQIPGFMGVEYLTDHKDVVKQMQEIIEGSESLRLSAGRQTYLPDDILQKIETGVAHGMSLTMMILDDCPAIYDFAKEAAACGATVYKAGSSNVYPSIMIGNSGTLQIFSNSDAATSLNAVHLFGHASDIYAKSFDFLIKSPACQKAEFSE